MTAAYSISSSLKASIPPADVMLRDYATVEEAAQRLGLTGRRVAQLCESDLAKRGLALKAELRELGDRKPRWYVARRYDLRLGFGLAGKAHQLPDLSSYTDSQVEQAWQRAACVDAFNDARRTWSGRQQDWLPTLCAKLHEQYPHLKFNERTLRAWQSKYRTPRDLEKLIDSRGGNQIGEAGPAAWEFFKRLFLNEKGLSIQLCWEQTRDAARENNWRWTSYKQCTRLLDRKIPPEMQAKYRTPRVYRQSFAPYIEQRVDAWEANQCWVGDNSPLDLWCRSGKRVFRPVITAWLDQRTRRIVGWILSESPDASTITAALRQGILDPEGMGPPEHVWIDNGKDFDSFSLHGQTKKQRLSRRNLKVSEERIGGILQHLGITAHWSLAHNPNGKSGMERWFGTLHDRFDRLFSTYCGKDSQHKPESLNAFLRERPDQVPTFEHVQERLREFIKGYNARSSGSKYLCVEGQYLSPDEAMTRLCTQRRVLADERALDQLMQQWSQPVRVGRNGVRIVVKGVLLGFGQFEPALVEFKGTDRRVHVAYDPEDLRSVRVFDERWRFICEARSNYVGSASDPLKLPALKEALAEKKRYVRAKREYAKGTHHEYLSVEETAAMEASRKAREERTPPSDPPPMTIVQTPFDGQAKQIEATQQFRLAAGGEHDGDSPGGFFNALRELGRADARSIPEPDQTGQTFSWASLSNSRLDQVDNSDENIGLTFADLARLGEGGDA